MTLAKWRAAIETKMEAAPTPQIGYDLLAKSVVAALEAYDREGNVFQRKAAALKAFKEAS
jgi:hypothetical protein